MMARLEQYAQLRDGELSWRDAAAQLGISAASGARYERWYHETYLGQPKRAGSISWLNPSSSAGSAGP